MKSTFWVPACNLSLPKNQMQGLRLAEKTSVRKEKTKMIFSEFPSIPHSPSPSPSLSCSCIAGPINKGLSFHMEAFCGVWWKTLVSNPKARLRHWWPWESHLTVLSNTPTCLLYSREVVKTIQWDTAKTMLWIVLRTSSFWGAHRSLCAYILVCDLEQVNSPSKPQFLHL